MDRHGHSDRASERARAPKGERSLRLAHELPVSYARALLPSLSTFRILHVSFAVFPGVKYKQTGTTMQCTI